MLQFSFIYKLGSINTSCILFLAFCFAFYEAIFYIQDLNGLDEANKDRQHIKKFSYFIMFNI